MSLLDQSFVDSYSQKLPPWGFNGMGEIVFLRTYSRKKDDGNNETWVETLKRVVNGAHEIGVEYTKKEAEALFDHMFNLRCSFSGRALWQLGTPLVQKYNGSSLNNCYFTNIEKIEDFELLFEYLMLGGGVGFSVERSKIHDLPKVKSGVSITQERSNDADIIVPDSRHGWKRLLLQHVGRCDLRCDSGGFCVHTGQRPSGCTQAQEAGPGARGQDWHRSHLSGAYSD